MRSEDSKFDVIIIGSGIGSMTCASLLSQLWNKRVLVLERHFKLGGFTHIFKRNAANAYEWDVGLHYVGGMKSGEPGRAMFDFISQGGVRWNKMADPFDVFLYPDLTFKAYSGQRRFEEDLIDMFPHERESIINYIKDVRKITGWYGRFMMARNFPTILNAFGNLLTASGKKLGLMTTGEYLKKRFNDEKLRAVLASQWGDAGLPPGSSAFVVHAVIAAHYFDGGYFPVGGSKTIADSILPIVEEKGGRMLVNHEVSEILIENNKAIGVRVVHTKKNGDKDIQEFFADKIISGAGAHKTYLKMIPQDYPLPFRQTLESFPKGIAHITAYLGLKENPQKLGYNGENLWIYNSYDHDQIFRERNQILNGEPGACFVSCPSLKNPKAEGHTLELISFVDLEPFSKWADKPWKNRGEEYVILKESIMDRMISCVEPHLPGLKDIIDYKELSTPLSTQFFTGHRAGEIYGLPGIPEKFKQDWLSFKTPVKNLFLTGCDTGIHGIVGSMMSGVFSVGQVMGMPRSIVKIFRRAQRFSNSLSNVN